MRLFFGLAELIWRNYFETDFTIDFDLDAFFVRGELVKKIADTAASDIQINAVHVRSHTQVQRQSNQPFDILTSTSRIA
jgi:hypothetical protein